MYGAIHTSYILCQTQHSINWQVALFFSDEQHPVFFRESYQRMNIWEKESKDPRRRCLTSILERRRWFKDAAVTKVFGSFGKPDGALYVDVLHALSTIQDGETINATARVNAQRYIGQLLKYKSLLTVQIFLHIFSK